MPTFGEVRGKGLRVPLSYLRSPILGNASGRKNLALIESLLGMKRGRILGKLNEIAAFAGMERYLDQRVSQYSSSMYGKLSLAAGLFCEPDVLLVDERIGGGDAPFRARVEEKLAQIVQGGATLVYASQTSAGMTSVLCRRAVWLAHGKVVAQGDANVVLPRYEAMSSEEDDEPGDGQTALNNEELNEFTQP